MGYYTQGVNKDITDFIGKVFVKIEKTEEEIKFYISEREYFLMYHSQDCCEDVRVEDVNGDFDDLVGTPILVAEEREERKEDTEQYESVTWTFYCIRTIKGSVDIRWCGESNGYYSESVDIELCRVE